MKKIKITLSILCLCLAGMTFTSCASKQSAVNQLEKFSYELRDNSQYYSVDDWKYAANKFMNIRQNISKHNYNAEEKAEIGRLEGQCAGYIVNGAKERVKGISSEVQGVLQGILKGIQGK